MTKSADWLGPMGFLVSGPMSLPTQIERLFAALPVLEGERDNVERLARSLYEAKCESEVADQPRNKTAARGVTRGELQKLAALALKLRQHIEAMHWSPSMELVNAQPRFDQTLRPIEMVWQLRELEFATYGALEGLTSSAQPRPKPSGKPSGARLMTAHAARVYEQLTGLRPTVITDPVTGKAGGAFLTFLEEVFREFKITASAESQARRLRRKPAQKT
jgi:hypothetical protein